MQRYRRRSQTVSIRLIKDPHLSWPSEFPYERLSESLRQIGHPGIDPNSSAKQINDALFDLMAAGKPSTEDRLAWDELRYLDRRLLADFFMYSLDIADDDLLSQSLSEQPMPVRMPDYLRLADDPPDLSRIITPPIYFDPGPEPKPLLIDPELLETGPVEIGPVPYDEADFFWRKYVER